MPLIISGGLSPFDDTLKIRRNLPSPGTPNGLDTQPSDQYRQGVELTLRNYFFIGTQPKLWGGTIAFDGIVSHEQQIEPFGQAVSFTQHFNNRKFDDSLPSFNPIAFVKNQINTPYAIIEDDIPLQIEEAKLEPLTIISRLPSTEKSSFYVIHATHANIENGSVSDGLNGGCALFDHFVDFRTPLSPRPFLDEGEIRLGEILTSSITMLGATSSVYRKIFPFKDQVSEYYIQQISGGICMTGALLQLKYADGQSLIPIEKRSSTAGNIVYGPNQAKYGTDSIAFVGRLRGS